jgi:hypothetical protein
VPTLPYASERERLAAWAAYVERLLVALLAFPLVETIRYACGDCQAVFDLCVAPLSEWAEIVDEDELTDFAPTCCPFCGSAELKMMHDRAVILPGNP